MPTILHPSYRPFQKLLPNVYVITPPQRQIIVSDAQECLVQGCNYRIIKISGRHLKIDPETGIELGWVKLGALYVCESVEGLKWEDQRAHFAIGNINKQKSYMYVLSPKP